MQKMKHKKHLTALAFVCCVTLLVGAAFAFGPGRLGIEGTAIVHPVDRLNVDWEHVNAYGVSSTTSSAFLVDSKQISWTMEFASGPAIHQAVLTASAVNTGELSAYITTVGAFWVSGSVADLGLSFELDTNPVWGSRGFIGDLPVGHEAPLEVRVSWDGRSPALHATSAALRIEFSYIP